MNEELAKVCKIFQWKDGVAKRNRINNEEWDKAAH
jgi:hypothetical protein